MPPKEVAVLGGSAGFDVAATGSESPPLPTDGLLGPGGRLAADGVPDRGVAPPPPPPPTAPCLTGLGVSAIVAAGLAASSPRDISEGVAERGAMVGGFEGKLLCNDGGSACAGADDAGGMRGASDGERHDCWKVASSCVVDDAASG